MIQINWKFGIISTIVSFYKVVDIIKEIDFLIIEAPKPFIEQM